MERRYVAIRPAAVASPAEREDRNPDEEQNSTLTKRRRIAAACEACRSRKTACDGKRPWCTPYVDRNAECIYRLRKDGPRGPWLDYIEFIERLSTASEADALNLLRCLRESTYLSDALSLASDGARDNTRSTSLTATGSLAPPAFAKLESELSSLYPIAYPTLNPINIRAICQESWNKFEPLAGSMATNGDMASSDNAPRLSTSTPSVSSTIFVTGSHLPVRRSSGSSSLSPTTDLRWNLSLCDSRLITCA